MKSNGPNNKPVSEVSVPRTIAKLMKVAERSSSVQIVGVLIRPNYREAGLPTTIPIGEVTIRIWPRKYEYAKQIKAYFNLFNNNADVEYDSLAECLEAIKRAWKGATPWIASYRFAKQNTGTKCPVSDERLTEMAADIWCELYSLDRAKLMKEQLAARVRRREKWIRHLRTGPPAVKKWNALRDRVELFGDDFSGINLRGAALDGITLEAASLVNANFEGASLKGASLVVGDYRGARFKGADLSGTGFSSTASTDFRGADFTGASLCGAHFNGSVLRGAKWADADFSNAVFGLSDLCGADLSRSKVSGAQLAGAGFDEKTRWPRDFGLPYGMFWRGKGRGPKTEPPKPARKIAPVLMEITPHVGVGPVHLGMTIKAVEAALKEVPGAFDGRSSRGSLHYFFNSSLQVELGKSRHVQFIGASACEHSPIFRFEGKDISDTPAAILFGHIARRDKSKSHKFSATEYLFPKLLVTLYEADKQYDYKRGESRSIFAQVGVGNKEYKERIDAYLREIE